VNDHGGRDPVDVALTLLAEQGFDATSIAQIADATGIPAEDVVPTLGTKDGIVLAVAKDMLVAVIDALADVDAQAPIVEALMAAHSRVVADIFAGTGPVSFGRMRAMSKAITSSRDLQKLVAAQRVDMLGAVLADRLGTSPTDDRVSQGLNLWSAVLAATYMDVLDRYGRFDVDVDAEAPEFLRDRLNRAFRIITGRPTSAQ
jgi:AcrR family transcriptional regulator